MCKTYHWTCHACGRSQSRGQRCSARGSGNTNNISDTNCPGANSRTDGPPPQAEHNGIRCAYCHTPSSIATNMSQPKAETSHTIDPASLASNTKWEARHPMMLPPSSWNTNASSPHGLGLQHQAGGYQSPSSGAAASNYIAVSTTIPPNAAAMQHQHYPSHNNHPQANFPHQRLGGNPASGSLPLFPQPHHHSRFTSPSSSGVPVDPQILPSRSHHQHPAPRSHPHGAASAPPFMSPTPASATSQHHPSAPQVRPLQQQGHQGPTPSPTPSPGASGEAASAARPHLSPTADMLASMNETRTALFVQAEAQRAAVVPRSHGEDEGVALRNEELQAAWYRLWEGCGVPHATVSAAAAAARNKCKDSGEGLDRDGESGGR